MNIVDLVVLGLIIVYILSGVYRGFMPSILNLGGIFISWIVSFLSYPLLSAALIDSEFFSSMRFYIEGAERVSDAFELTKLPVASITPDQLGTIMTEHAKMPPPFDTAIVSNVTNQSFADQGLTTLGEYFDQTIYCVIINIISLLMIYFVLRIIFTALTNAFSFSFDVPQLRRFDYLLGGAVGIMRGFFEMYMIFTIVPIALIFLPISQISQLVNDSVACSTFYSSSIILPFISGLIS